MIRGVWDYVQAVENGQTHFSTWRKTPSQANTGSNWFDLSMSPGYPLPQYYAATPLVAQRLSRSADGGLNHGPSVAPYAKYLKRFNIIGATGFGLPMPYVICDYTLFYPFIDTGSPDPQEMDNTISPLRYADGKGVQMIVVSVASGTGLSPQFTVNYTNSDGVAGRTSQVVTCSLAAANGSILTCHHGLNTVIGNSPFVGLQAGDKGVMSIQSVTFTAFDVGLLAIALVKPLATGTLFEQTAASEVELLPHQSQLPRIYDDAYLNLIVYPNAGINTRLFSGEIETVWNI